MIKFHKILEKNLKEYAPDEENIYFTEAGRMFVTDKNSKLKELGYLSTEKGGIVTGHTQFKRGLDSDGTIYSRSATTAFQMQNNSGFYINDSEGNGRLAFNMDTADNFLIGDGSHNIGLNGWMVPARNKYFDLGSAQNYWNVGYIWSVECGQIVTPDYRSGDYGAHRFDGHIEPYTNDKWQNIGQPDKMWGNIYTKSGAFNGSDIQLKENVKELRKEQPTIKKANKAIAYSPSIFDKPTMEKRIENTCTELHCEVTNSDFYNYVKDAGVYTFNYKQTDKDVVGIIANEIPDNIFSKMGTYAEVPQSHIDGSEDDEKKTIRMINSPSQIAVLQGALKVAIDKIESLEKRIISLEGGK